jgi:hypothetical protein
MMTVQKEGSKGHVCVWITSYPKKLTRDSKSTHYGSVCHNDLMGIGYSRDKKGGSSTDGGDDSRDVNCSQLSAETKGSQCVN